MAKPGLDGHSNGAEQIAVAARDAGFEVIYQGIRLTPAQIVAAARDEDVDIVGLSILSGSHMELVPDILDRLRAAGVDAAVVVGGIIPPDDAEVLLGKGVSSVYTPKDFSFDRIMSDLVGLAERRARRHSPRESAELAPGDGDRPEFDGLLAEALGQVVVVQGSGTPMALKATGRDAEPGGHLVQLLGIVRDEMRPAVLALADDGPLAPVVDVDSQGRARVATAAW